MVSRWVNETGRFRLADDDFAAELNALDQAPSTKTIERPEELRAAEQQSLESFSWHRFRSTRIAQSLALAPKNVSANVLHQLPDLHAAEYPDDLFLAESALSHDVLLAARLSLCLDRFLGSTSRTGCLIPLIPLTVWLQD